MDALKDRFMKFVRKTSTCWIWMGAIRGERGYGAFGVGGRVEFAHRVSYRMFVGRIPGGALVLHRCDVRRCVRPDHLYVGSAKRNTADMLDRGREAWGERSGMHKLTKAQITEIFDLRERGWPQQRIADRFGVTQSQISRILSRKAWRRAGTEAGRNRPPRLLDSLMTWRQNLNAIPNRDGYLVEVLLQDGSVRRTQVERGADGLHRLRGVEIHEVVAWMPGAR